MSKERERAGNAAVRPVSWREDEATRGAMEESEQETMLVWVSQSVPSIIAIFDSDADLRHWVSAGCGAPGSSPPTVFVVATLLPRTS